MRQPAPADGSVDGDVGGASRSARRRASCIPSWRSVQPVRSNGSVVRSLTIRSMVFVSQTQRDEENWGAGVPPASAMKFVASLNPEGTGVRVVDPGSARPGVPSHQAFGMARRTGTRPSWGGGADGSLGMGDSRLRLSVPSGPSRRHHRRRGGRGADSNFLTLLG